MNLLFIATGDAEGLIWFVVIIFGAIAQVIGAVKKANAKRVAANPFQGKTKPIDKVQQKRAQPATASKPFTLQSFLQSLAEQQDPVQPPVIPKNPTMSDDQQSSSYNSKLSITKKVLKKPAAPKLAPPPDYSHLQSSKKRFTPKSFHLPSIHLPSAGVYQSSKSIRTLPRIDFNLRNSKTLKRAIIGLTILNPPKALENDQQRLRL